MAGTIRCHFLFCSPIRAPSVLIGTQKASFSVHIKKESYRCYHNKKLVKHFSQEAFFKIAIRKDI